MKSKINQTAGRACLAALLLFGAMAKSHAEGSAYLTANDASGSTSWNTGLNWNNKGAPVAGTNYFTGGYLLRTPASGATAVFAGDSLTLQPNTTANTTAALNLKLSNNGVTTFNNATNAGGPISDGNGGDTYFISGNMVVTAPTAFWVQNDASRTLILSNLNLSGTGSGNLITNGMPGNGLGTIVWAGNATALTCPVTVDNEAVFKIYSQTNLGGNPPSFNAAQLLLNGAVFTPLASLALNNPNSGITITPNGANFNIASGLIVTNYNPLAGTGPLTNSGAGTLILDGSGAAYSGNVFVNAGTVALGATGTLPNSLFVSVASGETFDASAAGGYTLGAGAVLAGSGTVNGNLTDSSTSQISPGGAGGVGNLTLNNNLTLANGGTLIYDFNSTTNDLITVAGNLSPSGVTTVSLNSFPSGGLPNGNYVLLNVAGTLGGSAANFAVQGLETRKQYKIAYSGKQVLLQVSGGASANLVWTGDVTNGVANAWDLDVSTNWLYNGAATVYYDADSVNFTDAGTNQIGGLNQPTLDLVVNPATVTFNSASNYDLTSPTTLGSIVGSASVVQIGYGTSTMAVSNAYSGGTLITNGVLQMGNQAALGSPAKTTPLVVITNAGALDLNGYNTDVAANAGFSTNAVKISGIGNAANGEGALYSSSGFMNLGYGNVGINNLQLTGDATIGGSGSAFQLGNTGLGISGNNHNLTKVGSDTIYLFAPAVNSVSNLVVAGGGFVFVNYPNAAGASAPIVLTNGGWIDTWNSASWTGLTFANPIIVSDPVNGGQIHCNQGSYYNQVDKDTYNGNITLNGPLTIYSANYFNGAPNNVPTFGKVTVNGAITGTNGVIVQGTPYPSTTLATGQGGNIALFAGNNTYNGPTMVTNYIQLQITTANQGGGAYDVVDAGTLDVAVASGHPTLPVSTLTLDSVNVGPGFLAFSRLSTLSATTPIIYATNLVINYGTIIPPSAGYQIGQFPLIKYAGAIGGNGFNGLSLGALPNFVSASLVNNTANNSIDLLVTTTGLEWTGANSSSWDNSTENWLDPDGATADYYADGDAVNFVDLPNVNTNVVIPATVQPGGITVNTTNQFFFGGPAGISGTAQLIKTGPGILTIANSNNVFTGGTIINQGTLQLADNNYAYPYPGGALNDNLGVVTVNSGGTLDVNGVQVPNYQSYGPDGYNVSIIGSGVNGAGALVNNNTGNNDNADAGYVTLTGNATVGGLGDVNVRHGVSPQLSSQSGAYTLTKVGPGQFRVRYNAVVSTNFGNINVLQGIVTYESSSTNGFGDPTKTIFIGGGAGFALGTASAPFSKQIVASNNATIYAYNTTGNVLATPVNLVGGNVAINANYFNAITFSNVLFGAGGVTVIYNSSAAFAAANTYTGNTIVDDGNAGTSSVLRLIGNGSISTSPNIYLQGIVSGQANPGSLDASGRVDGTLTLAGGQTLRGDNGAFVKGNVVAASGSTITPGGLNNIQYFNASNNVTLQAGSTFVADVSIDPGFSTNDVLNASGALTYGGTLQLNASGATPLTAGSAFKLFNFGSQSGSFSTISGTPGSGLGWTFNPTTGVATVVSLLPSTPTNVTATVSGNVLSLSWPASYQGWLLQSNSVSLTVPADWYDISNTAAGSSYNITINPGQANVFYRLRHP